MSSLKELTFLAAEIEARLIESEGEVTEALAELMVEAERLPSKVDSISFVIDSLESKANLLKFKSEAYLKAAKTHENAVRSLKNHVK